ncbi:MAG: hypothetical protein QNK37_16210 [Acidobacteriota bacterium]|nr:hypothetical protein [Acidobacteriota bacterium]
MLKKILVFSCFLMISGYFIALACESCDDCWAEMDECIMEGPSCDMEDTMAIAEDIMAQCY